MKPNQQSDEWVMGQVAKGERDCLEVIVRRYATPLLTYLTRMTSDTHLGEELLQEVFLAVWTKRKTYKLDKPFRAWLYAIATNRCRLAFRRAKGRKMASLDEDHAQPSVADVATPIESMLRDEQASLVSAAIAQLPEPQRMVITLRVWGGMSYREIALAAGFAEATVRSQMHRGLGLLRKSLAPALISE